MKSILAAKMSAMRKRSALSSSASDGSVSRDGGGVPKEPSSHRGQMRVVVDQEDATVPQEDGEELVEIVLRVALDTVHVVAEVDEATVFEAAFAALKEIVWDHTECSLRFGLSDGNSSPLFFFAARLVDVETQLVAAIRKSDLPRLPEQVYVGVLVGRNVPSSPIQQRRASIGFSSPPAATIPAIKRRELLAHERPPRNVTGRDKLSLQYFKSGHLLFPCSINGDPRGLKLDAHFLYVFPSPDCFDRTACLFSYLYDQVDSCEVRGGTRLELRFHRSSTKQPTFIAFQAPDAQYIRDAISFFRHGMPLEVYCRRLIASSGGAESPRVAATLSTVVSRSTASPPAPPLASQRSVSGRRSSLTSFRDEDALYDRAQSRCVVIGCQRRCTDIGSSQATAKTVMESDANGSVRRRTVWYCDEHAPVSTGAGSGSPPRSPSKRGGLLTRTKSFSSTTTLIHTKYYTQSVRCHGTLQKSGGKYHLTKAWNPKIVALIETPVGGLLVYYDKLAHCPGLSDAIPKERRVIDLSSILCIRRESSTVRSGATSSLFAFDVVTVYRTWTFATSDRQEYEMWLHVLSDAIEKFSSMAPDKPLRFPVKCLRDPFQNLPSRSDGTTALEISSNGVTVCSGTNGESEVYNWYFTDIQKWSVAKQHDNALCCFLSCVGTIGSPTSTSDSHGSPSASCSSITSSTYHDFLFQTPEAASVCSAIEFFVGKCMAKLEILGVVLFESGLSRQPSRRPSAEPGAAKIMTSTAINATNGGAPHTGKQHALEPIQLLPVGVPVPTTAASSQSASTTSTVDKAKLVLTIDTSSALATAWTPHPSSVFSAAGAAIEAKQTADLSAIDCRPAELPPIVIPSVGNEDSAHCPCQDEAATGDHDVLVRAAMPIMVADGHGPQLAQDGTKKDSATMEERNTMVHELAAEHVAHSPDDTQNAGEEAATIPQRPISIDGLSPTVQWLETKMDAVEEGDGDRFESFEYCICTIGEAVGDVNSATDGAAESTEDEEFEDARCGGFDGTELSVVVFDGCAGNDEDSLVMLEDEEMDALAFDGCGEQTEPVEDDDADVQDDEDDDVEQDMRSVARVAIPVFTKRQWRDDVHVPAMEYDDALERETVYSVRFRRGRLQRS